MLSINWDDVWKMVETIKIPLIVIGVALALAAVVSIAVIRMNRPARKLTRSTVWVAASAAVVVAVVSMMYGGFRTSSTSPPGKGLSPTPRRPRWRGWATTSPTRGWSC